MSWKSRVCGREARTGEQLLDPGRRKEGNTVTAAQRDTPDTAAPRTGPHRITCAEMDVNRRRRRRRKFGLVEILLGGWGVKGMRIHNEQVKLRWSVRRQKIQNAF